MSEPVLTFTYGQRVITCEVSRRPRKTVRVQVNPDGSVRVLAPDETPLLTLLELVEEKAGWIAKQLRYFEQFRPLTPPRRYQSGETHRYLGRQYRLRVLTGPKAVRLVAGFIEVSLPTPTPEAAEQALAGWYRARATIYFRRVFDEVIQFFDAYTLPEPQLKLRHMPTRWGSCTLAGVIYLNPDLIRASGSCIEYVLVHELCHLVYHRHDKKFYDLLTRILPDWQKRKQALERMMA